MSKVMETIIKKQLKNHLDCHELLTTEQFGFRKGLGRADLLTALHNEWATTVSRGGLVRVLAIDIAGTFDRVSHAGLLRKVASTCIAGQLLTWLTDYLFGWNRLESAGSRWWSAFSCISYSCKRATRQHSGPYAIFTVHKQCRMLYLYRHTTCR